MSSHIRLLLFMFDNHLCTSTVRAGLLDGGDLWLTFWCADEEVGKLLAKLIHLGFAFGRKPLHAPDQGTENGPGCGLHVAFGKHALLDAAFNNETVRLFVSVSFLDYLSKQWRRERSEIGVRSGTGKFFEDGSYLTRSWRGAARPRPAWIL